MRSGPYQAGSLERSVHGSCANQSGPSNLHHRVSNGAIGGISRVCSSVCAAGCRSRGRGGRPPPRWPPCGACRTPRVCPAPARVPGGQGQRNHGPSFLSISTPTQAQNPARTSPNPSPVRQGRAAGGRHRSWLTPGFPDVAHECLPRTVGKGALQAGERRSENLAHIAMASFSSPRLYPASCAAAANSRRPPPWNDGRARTRKVSQDPR